MKIHHLDERFYLFGNKGAVWNCSIHIGGSGISQTLCGTPMLSTNWAAQYEHTTPGCPECIRIFLGLKTELTFVSTHEPQDLTESVTDVFHGIKIMLPNTLSVNANKEQEEFNKFQIDLEGTEYDEKIKEYYQARDIDTLEQVVEELYKITLNNPD